MGFTFLMDANTSKYFYNYFMGMKQTLVLLKIPGADRFARGAPGFFSRLHQKFLAQNLKIFEDPNSNQYIKQGTFYFHIDLTS